MVDSTLLGDWTEQYAGSQLNLSGFNLNFSDEFNTMSVGGSYGSPETYDWFAPARVGFGAATLVEPTAAVNPFTLGNGALTISMQQVNGAWQSGHMQTLNAAGQGYTQQYGYFEMSAKFPQGAGTWPAFWLLSADPTKPRMEIDIVEAYGGDDPNGHHAAIHVTPTAGSSLTQKVDNSEYTDVPGSMFDGQFHTYGALVTPEWIIVYYDRVELTRIPSSEFAGTPLYMAVTLAGHSTLSQSDPNAKYDMVVDYVRAYADPRYTGLVLNGTSVGDNLQGFQFNDTLDGAAGADTLAGGAGGDVYYVDDAGDKVTEAAGGGVDVVHTSVSYSGAGQEIENLVATGTGNVNLTGNGLANKLTGNGAANVLDGASGADTMSGGAGDDVYYVDDAGDRVVEGWNQGVDQVFSSVSFAAPGAYIENITLTGTANINAVGTDYDNKLTGNAGANSLDGGTGADTMSGGAGDDTYHVDYSGDRVVEAAGEGVDTILSRITFDLRNAPNVENLTLTMDETVHGYGNELGNRLTGNVQGNLLEGLAGDDTLTGGLGNDRLIGGDGRDVFVFDAALGASNVDVLPGFSVTDDTLRLDPAVFSALSAGALAASAFRVGAQAADADDRIIYNYHTGDVFYDSDGTGAAAQILFAKIGNGLAVTNADFVVGDASAALAAPAAEPAPAPAAPASGPRNGTAGADTFAAASGADTMSGGAGDDVYYVDDAGDRVVEGWNQGVDQVFSSVSFAAPGAYIENITLTGTANINAVGTDYDNKLTGNAGANSLDGGTGADTMSGGAGDDTYHVDYSGDRVVEAAGEGVDTILSRITFDLRNAPNVENLTLTMDQTVHGYGNELANRLTGNTAGNLLEGFAGDDTLTGGLGNDRLIGGDGRDVFVFDAALGGGHVDIVQGFNVADDTIRLDPAVFAALPAGALAASAFRVGSQAGDADDRIIYNSGTGDVFYDSDGTGAAAQVLFAKIGNGLSVTNADFVVGDASAALAAPAPEPAPASAPAPPATGPRNGTAGADTFAAASGADTMSGGAGDDVYYVDDAGDRVVEGWDQGVDQVFSSVSFSAPGAYIENVTLTGTANINAVGTDYDNKLTGNAGANVLDGGTGADTMSGGAGDDTYYVDYSGDRVVEAAGEGVDTVLARITFDLRNAPAVENVTLTMDQTIHAIGNDLGNGLTGNTAGNLLDGGAGDDTLNGGLGNDRLIGGDGRDVFVFDAALGGGHVDIVQGFNAADDTIHLENSIFAGLTEGALAAGAFRVGSQAGDADDRIIYNSGTGDLFYDADGTGAAAQVLFAKIGNGLTVTNADFVVI